MRIDYYTIKGLIFYYHLFQYILLCNSQQAQQYIDPITTVKTINRFKDNKQLKLVMSDEFELEGRSFEKGADKFFESITKPDYTNNAMQFYNSSRHYVTTKEGSLIIRTTAEKTAWDEWDDQTERMVTRTRNYTSGMIQSWNKFCFTGGVIELSIQLPGGHANAGGLWPAAWLMGNLARATFKDTTTGIWPWSYNTCGKIPYLSDKQFLNACENSTLIQHGLNPYQGRGSPEIDIFEVMLGHTMPNVAEPLPAFMSSSLQIAPGIPKGHRPKNGHDLNDSFVWYEGIRMSKRGRYNTGYWGQECGPEKDPTPERRFKYMEDALSVNTDLNNSHFQSHHRYRVEWQPGPTGYLEWYLDDDFIMGIDASVLHLTGALIPEEPMYIILNTAVSHSWGFPEPCDANTCDVCYHCYDCTNPDCQCTLPDGLKYCKNLPTEMKIDYIRIYQDEDDHYHSLGCSPENYPTAKFIDDFIEHYADWYPRQPSNETKSFGIVLMVAVMFTLFVTFILFCSNICSLIKYSDIPLRMISTDSVICCSSPTCSRSSPNDSHFSGLSRETLLHRATPRSSTESESKVVEFTRSSSKKNATERTPLIHSSV